MEPTSEQRPSSANSREEIARIASRHGARNVRVFGSATRAQVQARDVDILVKMAAGRSLLDLIALSNELRDALGVDVDVVSENGLSPYPRERILAEAVTI
jgi:predicted nucleotidyltransferase